MRLPASKSLAGSVIVSVLLLTLTFSGTIIIAHGQTSPSIVAYKVTGQADLASPGSESFWSSIPWTEIPLAANVPNGGHTPYILVKMANNGTDLFVLLSWNVTVPSYMMSSVFSIGGGPPGYPPLWYNSSSGQYVPAPPRSLEETVVKSYYVNSTYYSQDRVAVMWYLGGQSGTPDDCMVVGAPNGGALEAGGAADIWDFMFGATWNTTHLFHTGVGYPMEPLSKYYNWWNDNVSFTGVDYPAPPYGFALNLYTNASNLYEVGLGTGLFYEDVATNLTNPYVVQASARYSNGAWIVEMVRPMGIPAGAGNYEVDLQPGSTYDVAFAVWQGYYGENAFIKSISTFVTAYISTSPPPTFYRVNTLLYIDMALIVVVAVGAVITYLAISRSGRGGGG